MAGATRVAERIETLAEPEARWDQDTYGMKQGGMRLQVGMRGGGLGLRL
jgi:hypothetical protein